MLHMYIHVMEMSRTPEHALAAADQLRPLCPDNGHLDHMPTHIYFQCGRYADGLEVSRMAAAADRKYARHAGPFNFYTTARCHHLHAHDERRDAARGTTAARTRRRGRSMRP